MRSRLRRFLYVRIIALVLVVGVCAVAGSLTVGSLLFDNYMERAIRASIADSANKLDLYGTLIGYAIEGSRQAGRKALEILAQQYPSRSAALAAELPRLRTEAMELSVDEIYFIGPDGKVFATSFVPDQGLDLFSFGPAVRNLIVEELGSGKEVDQAVAYSFKTGDVNSYQYLDRRARNYVIEVSSRVRTAVEKAFPGYGYEGFISFCPGPWRRGGENGGGADRGCCRLERRLHHP